MSWLRLDDGAPEHRKILALSRADRWTWIELLAYCARQDDDGYVPVTVGEILRYVTPGFLQKCRLVGLIDVDEAGEMRVHDWKVYNRKDPTNAERQRRYRNAHRNADERYENRDVTDPRAQPRARGPSPTPPHTPRSSSVLRGDDDDDDLTLRLDELNPSDSQRLVWLLAASVNPELVRRQLAAALAQGRNPAAYLDALIERKQDPARTHVGPPEVERQPIDPQREAAARAELDALGPFTSREDELRETAAGGDPVLGVIDDLDY